MVNMRKNLVDFKHVKTLETDQAKLAYIKDLFKITNEEYESINSGYKTTQIINAGTQIINNSISKLKLSTSEALAQITYSNLNLLTAIPKREIGNKISKFFKKERRKTNANNIALLKKLIMEELGVVKFDLNIEREDKNPFGLKYNHFEQSQGFKTILPEELDEKDFFLIGVERSDRTGNQVMMLNGRSDDFSFYKRVVVPLIKYHLNLSVGVHPIRSSTNTPRIVISSKNYLNYLQELEILDEQYEFREIDFENLVCDPDNVDKFKLAYLMGMKAGGGHITLIKNRGVYIPQMQFVDKNLQYVPEIKRMIRELGLPLSFGSGAKRPDRLIFGKRSLEKMIHQEVPFNTSNNQKGLFVNPRHLDAIDKYGL